MSVCKDIYNEVGKCCDCCFYFDPSDGNCNKINEKVDHMECCENWKLGDD